MDSMSEKKVCLGANSDIISNLSENVTDQILIRLPIRDAVRTSVLSTKWRYKWTSIPELVFKDSDVPSPHVNNDKLINFIDRVLLLHSGFIHKFELSIWSLRNSSNIDCWILFLSRKNIKEFVFKPFPLGAPYKLPTCFFSAQKICTLELRYCVLKPPATFKGFSNLKSLYLYETIFDNDGFECLISKCPVLERLTWEMFNSDDHLNICSPNLKYLSLQGTFDDICFENTPLLSDVSIDMTDYMSDEIIKKFHMIETRNMFKILNSLPNLRKFAVDQYFIEFLGMGKIPEKLPFTCHHLNNLSLHLNFEYVNEICVTLCLLNSSPNLREVEIESVTSYLPGPEVGVDNFWEERTHIDWNMSSLQVVKIIEVCGIELEFIELLLANSPMLEMLSIRATELDFEECHRLKFLKELLILPRASPNAKIKFLEWNEE